MTVLTDKLTLWLSQLALSQLELCSTHTHPYKLLSWQCAHPSAKNQYNNKEQQQLSPLAEMLKEQQNNTYKAPVTTSLPVPLNLPRRKEENMDYVIIKWMIC